MLIGTAMAAAGGAGIPQFQTEYFSAQLFWAVLSFLLLLYLLRRFVFPVIEKTLDERTETIHQQLEAVIEKKKQAESLLLEYRQQLVGIEMERKQMLLDVEKEIIVIQDKRLHEIRDYHARCKQSLLEEVDYAKHQAKKEISNIAVDLALIATEKLIKQRPIRSDVVAVVQQIQVKQE